jgi:hypothetical protein
MSVPLDNLSSNESTGRGPRGLSMSVLAEAISVVVRRSSIERRYPGGLAAYERESPNRTFCADDHLARIGFMVPADVGDFVRRLERLGFTHIRDGRAADFVVIDQARGPTVPCDWVEHIVHPNGYSSVHLAGTTPGALAHPPWWTAEHSRSMQFVPNEHVEERLVGLARDDGVDTMLDYQSGREVFVARAKSSSPPGTDAPRAKKPVRGRYSIVWRPFRSESPTGRPLAREAAYPFFVDGTEIDDLEAGRPIHPGARSLMLGILVAYDDPTSFADTATPEQFRDALDDLTSSHQSPSLEMAMLNASAHLRDVHGPAIARVALTTASQVLPQSAMIRSDLISTNWELLRELPAEARAEVLRDIVERFRADDLPEINPGAAPGVVFAYFAALCVLGGYESEKESMIRSGMLMRIRHPHHVAGMRYLLSEPRPKLDRVL